MAFEKKERNEKGMLELLLLCELVFVIMSRLLFVFWLSIHIR